jgi:hypothetical protein
LFNQKFDFYRKKYFLQRNIFLWDFLGRDWGGICGIIGGCCSFQRVLENAAVLPRKMVIALAVPIGKTQPVRPTVILAKNLATIITPAPRIPCAAAITLRVRFYTNI